ncbi:separin protein [Coemansia sp. RSA 1646]|nr:separin protein [Coemansia sp. RSA 1646]
MSGGFYIGTSIEQDMRFGDASKKLLKQMDFSSIFKKPVDMSKVNIDAIKPWISERIKELLGLEDEVLYEFIVNMLEESTKPDPKLMQVNLTGFLESKTQEFMQGLWKVLLEAQKSTTGIPESFIQKKIEELKQKREQDELIRANIAIANERMHGQNAANNSQKTTRSGRKSRWDTPSSSGKDIASTDSRQQASRDSKVVSSAEGKGPARQAAEEQALKRLSAVAMGNGAKVGRTDIEFALGLVNQANKLFSKSANGIRKQCDAPGSSSSSSSSSLEKEGIQRTVRVVIAAFRFLYAHRSTAGFSALALEKTMSNFLTACTNAHLGLLAWDGLVFLRKLLLEHASTHIVASVNAKPKPNQKGITGNTRGGHAEKEAPSLNKYATAADSTQTSTRSVRKPASRLKQETASSLAGTEGISMGMRRLSINKAMEGDDKASTIHFPVKYCQNDLSFNTIVVTLLCNILRALSLSPKSQHAQKFARDLAQRQHSVLDWCLRVREMDRDSIDPFLGVCFRAYYALGSVPGGQSLRIRLLGILAYANTSKCDLRELLKYTTRGAASFLNSSSSTASDTGRILIHKQVAQYYASILEQITPLLRSASVSPELVEFCHNMARSRQKASDVKGSVSACQYVAVCAQQKGAHKDDCAALIARILVWDTLVHDALFNGSMDSEVESVARGLATLVKGALEENVRHTLAVWNSLALCADIIRRTAIAAYAELRQGKSDELQTRVSGAVAAAIGVATSIYDVYITRGAAEKAEGAGGVSVAALFSHSVESSLVFIQLALQFLEHDRYAQVEVLRHSDRLLTQCRDGRCKPDFLRNHSTVFFNRGAGLYQLKIYSQAAQAIERAIDSLSQWISLSIDKKQPVNDAFNQLCKRYEVAASAYQSNGEYDKAAKTYGSAIAWIISHFSDQIRTAMTVGLQKEAVLPPCSHLWNSSSPMDKLALFVDRYARMCAGRLQKDATEHHAMLSLQTHVVDTLTIERWLAGWLYELEAFYLRPFVTPATRHISNIRAAHLEHALHAYEESCPLGYARCLIDLAKISRDSGELDTCLDKLHAAMDIAKGLPENCVYSVSAIAECYAWKGIVGIERQASVAPNGIGTALELWTLIQRKCSTPGEDGLVDVDSGHMREVVDLMNLTTDLLMSRRMYSQSAQILAVVLDICAVCGKADKTWVPVAMQCLIGLGITSFILGDYRAAARHFQDIEGRCEPGVLPIHVEIASRVAHASFQISCGDLLAGTEAMAQANLLARGSLTTGTTSRSALSKRNPANPDTLVLFSKASFAYSVLALKQGDLADSVDFGLHSYRILYSLLKSLSISHKRTLDRYARRSARASDVESEDDPFAAPKPNTADDDEDASDDQEKSDAEFLAFSGNWELQRLLIDNLAHLSEVYSIRGSVKEAEYFLNKGLEITSRLNAPFQESFMRLHEADMLSRKSLWDECAISLHKLRESSKDACCLSACGDSAIGGVAAVSALVTEGDAWRRSGMVNQAQTAYSQAMEIVARMSDDEVDKEIQGICVGSVEDTPRIERIVSQLKSFERQRDYSEEPSSCADGKVSDPILVLQEDIGIRQQLLKMLDNLSKAVDSGEEAIDVAEEQCSRTVDQKPEHLLMQAKLIFSELQRILEMDESYKMVFKSAFVFPALQRSRTQKPRKGTLKAQIKNKLAKLDVLLTSAVETAISVGSAHCVHSSSHLLVLVKAIASVFGFETTQEDCTMMHRVLSQIIDGTKNITVVREAVDVLRRRGEFISAQLTVWPSDIITSNKSSGSSSPSADCGPSELFDSSPVQFRVNSTKPSSLDHLPPPPLGMLGQQDTTGNSSFLDCEFLKSAADGRKVISGLMSSEARSDLGKLLPSSWVVCGISVDHSCNMLHITRYEKEREPISACLPMREIELDLEGINAHVNDMATPASVFDSVYRNIAAIIDASDKSMKTGRDCNTETEKRGWWEQRASLDRSLGAILHNIQGEWLGGFHCLLDPTDIFGLISDSGDMDAIVASLKRDIQTCFHKSLPKSFATKAKAIELADQLCVLVLYAGLTDGSRSTTASDGDNTGSENNSEWLDVCAMLWDVYSYQGAAPPCTDDSLNMIAGELKRVMCGYIDTYGLRSSLAKKSATKQRHLVLALDKYAQQIPWECLPCLRNYPVSRMPSVAFIKHRLVAMDKKGSSQPLGLTGGALGRGLDGEDLFSDLDVGKSLLSSAPSNPGTLLSSDIPNVPTFSAFPLGECRPGISGLDNGRKDCCPGVRVDGSRVFYVLNPEGDLHRTQENFESFLCAQPEWRGVVGRRPMNHECDHGLSTSDIFMYFGHGGAETYIQRSQIRALRRCAVALLLGCSSGRLKLVGEYDALGTAMDYIIGGCPALVGNLWDVGDKDIDRFAARMLHKWGLTHFSEGTIAAGCGLENNGNGGRKNDGDDDSSGNAEDGALSLAEAVCDARKAYCTIYTGVDLGIEGKLKIRLKNFKQKQRIEPD